MFWQTGYIIIIFAAAFISLAVAVYAWQRREQKGALAFAGMMLAVAEWLVTSGCVSLSRTPEQARWWVDPRFFGLTAMLAFYIVFIIQYSGHGKWLSKPLLAVFFSIPVITQIVIETNAFHHWFIVDVGFSPDGYLMGIDSVTYGPFFWFHTVYSYLLVLFGIFLIVQMAVRSFHIYRQQVLLMVFGIIPPLFTSVADAFLLIPGLKHPLAPIGFAIMGLCFGSALFRHRMLEIVPVARDMVIESMSDSMIVLDIHDKVVDVNPAAQNFLKMDALQIIGKPIREVFPQWQDLPNLSEKQAAAETEIRVNDSETERFYDVRISTLKIRHKAQGGRVVVLRDITPRKQAETKLKQLQEKFYEQSIHDPLTGLYNRRFLNESLEREISRAKRSGHPVSIAILDIDYFKEVNDTYGHEAGDVALIHLAGIMTKLTRAGDFVFRYGGEEFLIMLPATSHAEAHQFAERCRQHIEGAVLAYADQQIHLTVSIGVATFGPQEAGPERVLKAADAALYQAKTSGRNCVMIDGEEK